MRLAILSDIHGNFIALETVLADLKRAPVDRLVCLGDVAMNGPQPREVFGQLKQLGCPIIMGNADEFLLAPEAFEPKNDFQQRIKDLGVWARQQLGQDDLDFLRTFQPCVEIALEKGKTLLCFHGSPKSNEDIILATTADEELARMLGDFRATIMAGGHTHTQMLRRYQSSILINPGSIGLPVERAANDVRHPPWAEYAIIHSQNDNLAIEFRRVPFDFDKLVRVVRASGMPNLEWWLGDWRQ